MFENLSAKLQGVFKNLRNRGKLTEKDVDLALKEVRMALLEADVNFKVVKDFEARVRARAVGEECWQASPCAAGHQDRPRRAHRLDGRAVFEDHFRAETPTLIMLVGLQGSGKTTTCGKLAALLRGRAEAAPCGGGRLPARSHQTVAGAWLPS